MRKVNLFLLSAFLVFSNCSKETVEVELTDDEFLDVPTEINFVYQGILYSSPCELIDEDLFIINEEVRDLMDSLSENPNLATFFDDTNGSYHFYDSYAKMEESLFMEEDLNPETRATPYGNVISLEVWLSENVNNKKNMGYEKMTTGGALKFPSMGNKNDKLSSLELKVVYNYPTTPIVGGNRGGFVVLYQHDNYNGYSICFGVDRVKGHEVNKISNLKNYYMPNGKNWNDVASSWSMHISSTIPGLPVHY